MSEEQAPAPLGQIGGVPSGSVHVNAPHPFQKLSQVLQLFERHAGLAQDPTRFLTLFVEEIVKVMGADVAFLFGWDEAPKEWVLLSHQGMPKDFGKNGPVPRAWQSLPSIILQQGDSLFSNEISKDPRFIGQIIRGMNIQSFAGVTLRTEGKVLGSLSLGFLKPYLLQEEDQEIFILISKLVSPFLSQSALIPKEGKPTRAQITAEEVTPKETLEKEVLQKNIQIGILESLFASLGRPFKEEDVFKAAIEKTLSLMGAEGGYLLRLDEKEQRLFLLSQKGLSPEEGRRLSKQGIKAGENAVGKILEKRSPILVISEDGKTHLKKRWVGEEGLLSYMGVPVQVGGQVWGTLSFFSRAQIFSQDDLKTLGFAAKEIGLAVDNMTLFDQTRRRVEELTIMNEVSQSITKSLHLEQLLSSVANRLTRMIAASNCYIFSLDDKRNLLYGVAASDQQGDAIRKVEIKLNENTLAPLAVRERRPFAVENAPQDPRVGKKWIETFKSRSLLSIPLMNKERVIGVLLLDETRYFREFTPEEIQRIGALSAQLSVAIENATLYQSVTQHMERLQTLSSAIVNIQEEDRRRIAQELNDGAGQALTGVRTNLEEVTKDLGEVPEVIKERIAKIQSQLTQTQEALQRLSSDLRPAILDESGLVPTLRWYIEEYSKRTGIAVHLQTTGTQKRFSPKIEILLYRIIQEALTNVARHAEAKSVVLALEKKDLHAHLNITDDGKGFVVKKYFSAPPMLRRGLGILGMKERVELAGGTFFLDSDPGQGTRISVKVPIVKRGS